LRKAYRILCLKAAYPLLYRLGSLRPIVEGKVVFVSYRGREMPSSFENVWNALKAESDWRLSLHLLQKNTAGALSHIARCLAMIWDISDAAFVIASSGSNTLSHTRLRQGTAMLQLWHACGAFKKFGYSTAGLGFGGDEKELDRYPNYANDDYAFVSSEEVIWAYEEAFGLGRTSHAKVLALGVPRTDAYFDRDVKKSAQSWLYELAPIAQGKKVIAYLPTFRGPAGAACRPEGFDGKAMQEAFSGEYCLIIKQHPYVRGAPFLYGADSRFAADISGKMDTAGLLMAADLLITDYSSVVFEYSLTEKPMVFFAPDIGDYEGWRGFYYPYEEFCPGPIATDSQSLVDAALEAINAGNGRVRAFREKFMSACDGKSTKRVIDFMRFLRQKTD